MKYFWYPVALFCFCVLAIFTVIKNTPRLIYNKFHVKKRKYWHPVDWIAKEEYDIYE